MCELYKPICEVGSARSGTNFLSRIIAQHEDLAFWSIPKYVWRHGNAWVPHDCLTAERARPRVVRYIRRRFARYTAEQGKKRFFETTQQNVLALPFVNAVLPDCKIIHIIRDGRDVASSLHNQWTRKKVPIVTSLRHRMPSVPLTDWPAYAPEILASLWRRMLNKEMYNFGPKPKNWKALRAQYSMMEYTAITWRECVTAARSFGQSLPPDRYREIRFEDLFTKLDEVIGDLLEFLELPPSDAVMRFCHEKINPEAKGRWQRNMKDEDLEQIVRHAGPLLKELNMI